ncbi:PREDICTED: disease resistance protein LAZ5-like [Camelina sativa]|uniref:ADP-ribosyl cyclase/cyclic ADP-ribose hydrolase n=1 Tax=Camelina sativa TaxID=90675 RepID=A0ABM0X6V9_CAMSA|nr:PREDICTED: disease resistance protein LAZ5-like [Camelina sativa]
MAASSGESWQVFINFRGEELRGNFISHLEGALTLAEIKYYIDTKEVPSEDLTVLFTRIEQSEIALSIFSSKYAESKWCLDELVKITEQVQKGKLRIIPVFFNVTPEEVKEQKGEFGLKLYGEGKRKRPNIPNWENALQSVPSKIGLNLKNFRNERELVDKIVDSVKRVLAVIPLNGISKDISTVSSNGNTSSKHTQQPKAPPLEYGMEQRLKQLEGKLDFDSLETQLVGIVGMPGIGKTALSELHFKKWNNRFVFKKIIRATREESNDGSDWFKDTLMNGKELDHKAQMFNRKIFVVLDDVSHKNQVNFLLENLEWIKKGSKILITTRDKSTIADLVHDTYMVPGLNDKEALELFKHHAFNDQDSSTAGNFMKLSEKFVDYAGGNPLALKELGKELCGEDEAHWEARLVTLPYCCSSKILTELRISYDKLSEQQKDAFLDVACFFRSEEEDYVKCLLDPYGPESGEDVNDLAEKLFIGISAGRIEMHNILCTFGQELGSSDENKSGERMWNHEKITNTLRSEEVTLNQKIKKVRGIFLDTAKVENGIPIDPNIFIERFNQQNLRYLKIYDSLCPQQCDVDCKVNLPDGLEFPFQEIRYLHWLKFPLDELPPDFNPENLIDLRLPYSKIKRVWEAVKETPWLKWVDLSYSNKLTDLSALSKAFYLRRLNLEGCTFLDKLPKEMKNMKSLVFLNLRGCVMLSSLPERLDLVSLKTLILSGCSKFINFELLSENLEYLHLDGTAIQNLPWAIQNFQKLALLNLKDCKMLKFLPECLDKLKALKELILSGCAKLTSFPDIKENMENLQILLLDGTKIKDLPNILFHCGNFKGQVVFQRSPRMNGLSMLRRLCLSRNDEICTLQSSISQLHHLNCIDLKYCKNLLSIPTLPPNLQCLDAHACNSLKEVASPLALLMPTQQIPCSFIFTNCEKLEHSAKNEIICYAHNKSRMISDALNRHNKGLAFEALVATCFPGSDVPAWFSHKASGAVLDSELPRHWSKSGFVGIALCAIVSFKDHTVRNNNLQVKCICEFSNVETFSSYFNCHVGGLSETGDEQRTIKSTHVFIGYTNWLNINKFQEKDCEKECVPTRASIKFEVTDGTGKVSNCEVLKCGFSLVFESGSWEGSSRTEHLEQVENRWLGPLRRIRRFLPL